jgi:hypothetical protein
LAEMRQRTTCRKGTGINKDIAIYGYKRTNTDRTAAIVLYISTFRKGKLAFVNYIYRGLTINTENLIR